MLCGSAKNMNQLIFSRAFQGIGGGGMQTYAYPALLLFGLMTTISPQAC